MRRPFLDLPEAENSAVNFAANEVAVQFHNALESIRCKDFEKAERFLRLVSRALSDIRSENRHLTRWAGEAKRWEE